jgi:hypothetical protein
MRLNLAGVNDGERVEGSCWINADIASANPKHTEGSVTRHTRR